MLQGPRRPDDLRVVGGGPDRLGRAGQLRGVEVGLVGLARSVARELGSRGITANVVAPGFVDTDMTRALPDARRAEILGQVPLGRYATPDEGRAGGDVAGLDGAALRHGAIIPSTAAWAWALRRLTHGPERGETWDCSTASGC
jgi:hypothetical protein